MGVVVFVGVVLARFLVPLAIPRFPLPGIVLSLVIDAVDQTVFEAFDVEPTNYQSYDKALDIYYLTITYLSTLRDWTNGLAFRISQFLWYYRLVGVVVFELSGARAALLIFPNTFEYFFIFYEVVRLWWSPKRLTRRVLIGAAAAIWIGIKLPQEYWIHVAQLDLTDTLGNHPVLWLPIMVVAVAATIGWGRFAPRLPRHDWSMSFDVEAHPTTVLSTRPDPTSISWPAILHPLVEKTVLVGLVVTIFTQFAPDPDDGVLRITLGVGSIVTASAYVSYWLGGRGRNWAAAGRSFVGTGAINLGTAFVLGLMPGPKAIKGTALPLAMLLIGLLTLIVVLYDRYHKLRSESMASSSSGAGVAIAW